MKPMAYIPEQEDDEDEDEDDEQLDDVVERERTKLERKQKRLDEHFEKNPTKDEMVVFRRMNKCVNDR